MITLFYVLNGSEQKVYLNDEQTNFDYVLDAVSNLFNQGVNFVKVDTTGTALDVSLEFNKKPDSETGETVFGKYKSLFRTLTTEAQKKKLEADNRAKRLNRVK